MAGRRTAYVLLSIDMEKFPEIECCMRKAKCRLICHLCVKEKGTYTHLVHVCTKNLWKGKRRLIMMATYSVERN